MKQILKRAALILFMLAPSAQAEQLRAGVMLLAEEGGVVAIDEPLLAFGTVVTLVTIDSPQQALQAAVGARLEASEIMAQHMVALPSYGVAQISAAQTLPDFAVAVVGKFNVAQEESGVVLQSDKFTGLIHIRSCTSSEGLHLTLWSGRPLESKRLWHMYYYLGYDVAATCEPADY